MDGKFHGRMSQEELNELCSSIHDKKDDEKPKRLGKAKLSQSSFMGVTFGYPKKNCKKCFGKGYIGKDTETGMPIQCKCSMRPKPDDWEDQKPSSMPPDMTRRSWEDDVIARSNIRKVKGDEHVGDS